MSRKISILFLLIISIIVSTNGQSKSNIVKLGKQSVIVKGTQFNQIEYRFADSKNKYVAYQFTDKKKKVLIISEVSYESENGKFSPTKIEIFTCPLDKISKQNSYNLEMEDDAVSGGKYWRLTLVSSGNGADNLYFQRQTITTEAKENKAVNNVTVNIINKTEAEKRLKLFTK
jgi:hypothetical protein